MMRCACLLLLACWLVACSATPHPITPPPPHDGRIPQATAAPTLPLPTDEIAVVAPIMTDAGLTWAERNGNLPPHTMMTTFLEDAGGWWAGSFDEVGLWHSTDNGQSWQAVPGFGWPVFALTRTGTVRWAATSRGLQIDDGSGWQAIAGLPDEEVLDAIPARAADGTPSPTTVYAVLGAGGLWRVTGTSVEQVAVPPATLEPTAGVVSVASYGEWFLLGTSGAGVWQSYDNGQSWQPLLFDERAFAPNLLLADGQRGWVQTRNGL